MNREKLSEAFGRIKHSPMILKILAVAGTAAIGYYTVLGLSSLPDLYSRIAQKRPVFVSGVHLILTEELIFDYNRRQLDGENSCFTICALIKARNKTSRDLGLNYLEVYGQLESVRDPILVFGEHPFINVDIKGTFRDSEADGSHLLKAKRTEYLKLFLVNKGSYILNSLSSVYSKDFSKNVTVIPRYNEIIDVKSWIPALLPEYLNGKIKWQFVAGDDSLFIDPRSIMFNSAKLSYEDLCKKSATELYEYFESHNLPFKALGE